MKKLRWAQNMRLPRKLPILNWSSWVRLSNWLSNGPKIWVKSSEDESTKVVLKGRPHRLGLGAAVPRESQVAPSNDTVERKLHPKLDPEKRKAGKNAEESLQTTKKQKWIPAFILKSLLSFLLAYFFLFLHLVYCFHTLQRKLYYVIMMLYFG